MVDLLIELPLGLVPDLLGVIIGLRVGIEVAMMTRYASSVHQMAS